MAENIENNGCSQRDNAEHEGYVKASRSFNRIWKERDSAQPRLLEAILYKDNFNRAYKRVKANKGAPGIDGFKKDLEALKKKVDAGAEYLVTQIFFDNDYYYRLVREARKIGITVPILAGIMPITNAKSLIRTTKMCGCTIPYQLSTMIEAHYDNPEAMKEIGINYAAQQIIDLITNGVDGIHIYTMNRAETAQRVFDSIPAVLKELN